MNQLSQTKLYKPIGYLSHKMFECKKSEIESTNYPRDNGSGIVSSEDAAHSIS